MKVQVNSEEPRRNSFCVWWHSVNVQIAIAVIGMSAGLMAGVVFAMQYQNWSAVTLCFTALLFSTLLLHIHLAYKWQRILEWPTALFNSLIYFNTLACVISLIGMVYCLVVAAIEGQGLTPEELKGNNLWITAVWFFMTAKYAGLCVTSTRRYYSITREPLLLRPLGVSPTTITENEKAQLLI